MRGSQGVWELYSYGVKIVSLKLDCDVIYAKFYHTNKYTRTTLRHLREFAKQYGNDNFASFVNTPKKDLVEIVNFYNEKDSTLRFAEEPDEIDSTGRIATYYI